MARVVFFLIGLLLSVTAGLKLWMLMTDPFAALHSGLPVSLLLVATFLEFSVLAIVLFGNYSEKWISCFLLFLSFFVASSIRLIHGNAACGCAGPIALPTALIVSIDSLILLALFLVIPPVNTILLVLTNPSVWGRCLGLAVVLFALFTLPSVNFELPFFPTNSQDVLVTVSPPITDESKICFGVTVKNLLQDRPIEILGMDATCNCVATEATFPKPIDKGSEIYLEINVFPRTTGEFYQQVRFFLGSRQYVVVADLKGSFMESRQ